MKEDCWLTWLQCCRCFLVLRILQVAGAEGSGVRVSDLGAVAAGVRLLLWGWWALWLGLGLRLTSHEAPLSWGSGGEGATVRIFCHGWSCSAGMCVPDFCFRVHACWGRVVSCGFCGQQGLWGPVFLFFFFILTSDLGAVAAGYHQGAVCLGSGLDHCLAIWMTLSTEEILPPGHKYSK